MAHPARNHRGSIPERLGSILRMVIRLKWWWLKESISTEQILILIQESHWTMDVNDVITTQEYAKNIGLIRQYSRDTITGDTILKSWLIDYYVSFDSTSIDY